MGPEAEIEFEHSRLPICWVILFWFVFYHLRVACVLQGVPFMIIFLSIFQTYTRGAQKKNRGIKNREIYKEVINFFLFPFFF